MSGLFSPKIPKAPEPVKPPTIDDTRQADEELMRLRRRKGLASTFLVSQRPRRPGAWSQLTDMAGGAAAGAAASGGGGAGRATTGGGSGSGPLASRRLLA
jgi:hypothetical protein